MTTESNDNGITLPQGIGFAITILIFFITAWVNLNSRIAVVESQQKDVENSLMLLTTMQREITEVKISIKYIEQSIRDDKEKEK